jgi:hypothetical protein
VRFSLFTEREYSSNEASAKALYRLGPYGAMIGLAGVALEHCARDCAREHLFGGSRQPTPAKGETKTPRQVVSLPRGLIVRRGV